MMKQRLMCFDSSSRFVILCVFSLYKYLKPYRCPFAIAYSSRLLSGVLPQSFLYAKISLSVILAVPIFG